MFRWLKGNERPLAVQNYMDRLLLSLSELDGFLIRSVLEGVLILAGVGAGKTQFIGRCIAQAMLNAGFGFLFLCGKATDRRMYEEWASRAGRRHDVVVLDVGGRHAFNIFAWEQHRKSRGAGVASNIVATLEITLELLERNRSHGAGDNVYWPRATREALINAATLHLLARTDISALGLSLCLNTAPRGNQYFDPRWREQAYMWTLFQDAKAQSLSLSEQADLTLCEQYFGGTFAHLEDKTRGIICSIAGSMLEPFMRSPLRELFCDETTFTPEQVFAKNQIVIVDLSPMLWYEVGRIGSVIIKYLFQRALMMREIHENTIPFCFWMEEYPLFCVKHDAQFAALSREMRGCNVALLQSLPLLYSAMGGDGAKQECESILGIFKNKIFGANACPITNAWASTLLGREIRVFSSGSVQHQPRDPFTFFHPPAQTTASFSTQYEMKVQADAFASLETPSAANGWTCEAVVYQGGKPFKATGDNYLVTYFGRG